MKKSSKIAIDTLVAARMCIHLKILKKPATVLALSAILAFVAVVGSACNAETPAKAPHEKVVQSAKPGTGDGGGVIPPCQIGSGTALADDTTASAFVVPINYGHVKLWLWNHDSAPVTVTVQRIESDMFYVTETLEANEQFIWRSTTDYPQGMSSGNYSVNYHSSTGSVNVQYSGFASDNKDDVKN